MEVTVTATSLKEAIGEKTYKRDDPKTEIIPLPN